MNETRVYVWHSSGLKVGKLIKLGRKVAKVEVPIGSQGATKLITVRRPLILTPA